MNRVWLIKDLRKLWNILRSSRRLTYVAVGIVGILILGLSAYKIRQIVSPTNTVTSSTGATITFKTSDNYLVGSTQTPLPNDINDGTLPTYTSINPTQLGQVGLGTTAVIPRIEGEVALADNCKNFPLDLVLLIDSSSSMTDYRNNINGRTRFYYAQQAAYSLIDKLAENNQVGGANAYHRVGIVSFREERRNVVVNMELGDATVDELKESIRDIRTGGGTPLKYAIEVGAEQLNTNARYPINDDRAKRAVILLTDGMPDPDSMTPTIAQINTYHQSADMAFSVLINDDDNADAVSLLQSLANPPDLFHDVQDASTLPALYKKLLDDVKCSKTTADETISLPPSALFSPSQFQLEDITYDFAEKCGSNLVGLDENGPCFKLDGRAINNVLVASASSVGIPYYVLTLPGFTLEHTYHWRVTFKGISGTDIIRFINTLPANRYSFANFTLARDSSCNAASSAATVNYLCPITTVAISTSPATSNLPNQTIKEAYRLIKDGIVSVEGNVVAGYSAEGFSLSTPNAILYGGDISKVIGGDQLENYLVNNNSALQWSQLESGIEAVINEGETAATEATKNPTSKWYLNSPSSDPTDVASATTFSSPPEGKLWSIDAFSTSGAINFSGSGTIIVNGSVTFGGDITCSSGSRLGIIALGSITFASNNIGCGAYLAFNGSITFQSKASGKATGIFVAKDNINLPRMNEGAWLDINYDTTFSSNPTVLFSEILNLIEYTTIS